MSSTPEPRVAEPEAPADTPLLSSAITQDIIDQIEILRCQLLSAKHALTPVQSAAMPLIVHEPLRSPPESAPVPAPEPPQPLPSLDSTHDVEDWRPAEPPRPPLSATLGWTAVAVGTVVLVAGLWPFGDETASRIPRAAALPVALESAPAPPPTFSQADATGLKTAQPNDIPAAGASEPAISELMTEVEIHPVESAAAGVVLATEPSPVEENPPHAMHDPVESVIVTGLPPSVTLSAGHRISESDWEIPPEHASNLGLVVPGDQTDPVRADIEFKSRQGFVMARLGLNGVHEPPPVPAVAVEASVGPEETMKEIEPTAEPAPIPVQQVETTMPPEEEVRVFEQKPARVPPPKQKPKTAQAKSKPPMSLGLAKPAPAPVAKTAAVPKAAPGVKAAPQPRGLFQIGPGGIVVSLASPPPAPPAAATTAPTAKPAAPERDRPPGFETLETLGGGFALDAP